MSLANLARVHAVLPMVRPTRTARGFLYAGSLLRAGQAVAPVWLAVLAAAGSGCGGESGDPIPSPEPDRSDCREEPPPIERGFGAPGPHAVEILTISNPAFPQLGVTLHRPVDVAAPPMIVFGHGNGLADPHSYSRLLHHIASRGYAVVYASHQLDDQSYEDRYRALWSGVSAAVSEHSERLDLDRVGFVGHSYGAGALPYLAHRALVDEGFGRRGALLLSMAPWYALGMTGEKWSELPDHLEVLILSFEDDEVTDHRIAIDLHDRLAVERNTYLMVRSDDHRGCELRADHSVPQSAGLGGRHDALDEYAVFRLFDALAASVFQGDPAATRIANGLPYEKGSRDQLSMRAWTDGVSGSPLYFSTDPQPAKPESHYLFKLADREAWLSYPYGTPPSTAAAEAALN